MKKTKTAEQIIREAIAGKPARRPRRAKTAADVWFEQMKADFVQHGAEHLKSAREKLGSK